MSTILYAIVLSLEQGAAKQRTIAASLHVWVVILLLLLVASANGMFVENSADTILAEDFSRNALGSKGKLFISIYLNGTEYSSNGTVANAFTSALLLDLYESFFYSFQLSDASLTREQVLLNVPRCSLREMDDTLSPVHFVFCTWRPNHESLVDLSIHRTCRNRMREILQTQFLENRELFARTTMVYRIMTNDSRHLAAVGGDCKVQLQSFSKSSACGALSCWALGAIIASCCVFLLLIVIVGYVLYNRYTRRLMESRGIPPASVGPGLERSERDRSTDFKAYNTPTPETGIKQKEYVGVSNPCIIPRRNTDDLRSCAPSSLQLLVHADVQAEEGIPIDINDYLADGDTAGGYASCPVSAPEGSPAVQTVEHSPKRSDGTFRLFRSLDIGNKATDTAVISNGIASVQLSAEEREQLQRQGTWLCAHVVGLDSL